MGSDDLKSRKGLDETPEEGKVVIMKKFQIATLLLTVFGFSVAKQNKPLQNNAKLTKMSKCGR